MFPPIENIFSIICFEKGNIFQFVVFNFYWGFVSTKTLQTNLILSLRIYKSRTQVMKNRKIIIFVFFLNYYCYLNLVFFMFLEQKQL